jgi:hypothetical protein
MARGRMISKSLSYSEKFAALGATAGPLAEFCQALYPLLVVHADDFGRLQGDVLTVKAVCFPTSTRSLEDFGAALEHVQRVGLIAWYLVDAKRFIQIQNWDVHQRGLYKRVPSVIVPNVSEISPDPRPVSQNHTLFSTKGREGKGSTGRATRGPVLTDPAPSPRSVPRKSTDRRAPDGRAARAASAPLPPDKLALLKKYGFD